MPARIYSLIDPTRLLHIVSRFGEITEQRLDIVPEAEGLQVACYRMPKGKKFRPHLHVERPREVPRTQECWIVLNGTVRVEYYDVDGSLLTSLWLRDGDCSITLAGGHSYQCLEADSTVYEVKLGPFVGTEDDKRFIE